MANRKRASQKTLNLRHCLKSFEGYKVCPPEITVARIGERFAKLNLAVRIAFEPAGLVPDIGSYYRCAARLVPDADHDAVLGTTYGKGLTPALSAASGAAEMVERFTAQMNIKNRGKDFELNQAIGLASGKIAGYPKLFSEAARKFVPSGIEYPVVYRYCTSLISGEISVYPAVLYRFWQTSQGLAAGNTLEEAVVQGICEVIERSTLRAVLGKGLARPEIDPESFDTPLLRKLHSSVKKTGVGIAYFDWSLWGIPVVGALFQNPREPSPQTSRFVVGVATSPTNAALRCLLEYLQQGNPCLAGPDVSITLLDRWRAETSGLESVEHTAFTEALGYNKALPAIYGRRGAASATEEKYLSELPNVSHRDLLVEIRRMSRAMNDHGLELWVDDLTLPALDFPVIRVIPVAHDSSLKNLLNPIIFHNNPSDSRPLKTQIRNVAAWQRTGSRLFKELAMGRWRSRPNLPRMRRLISRLESHIKDQDTDCFAHTLHPDVSTVKFLTKLSMAAGDLDRAQQYNEACMITERMDPDVLLDRIWISRKRGDERTAEDCIWLIRQFKPEMDIEAELKHHEVKVFESNPFDQCNDDCDGSKGNPLCRECILNYVPIKVWRQSDS